MKCKECGFDIDKFKLLRLQIQELADKVKEAQSAYDASSRLLKVASEIHSDNPQIWKTKAKMMKQNLMEQLDLLRLKVDRIRKIAPNTAEFLDKEIEKYESSGRYLIESVEKFSISHKVPDTNELLAILGSFLGIINRTDEMVDLASSSIQDVLKKFEQF